jgi:hypothetical protein
MTPRIHIISAHAGGDIDPTLTQSLFCVLPNRTEKQSDADVVIVSVSNIGNFQLNPSLHNITKPIVVVDFMEYYGSQLGKTQTHLFGVHDAYEGDNWRSFHQWLVDHPPILYFKRELLESDRSARVLPIEWPCQIPAVTLQSKAEFDARPFQLYFSWGYSNPLRPRLAGEIYGLMAGGYHIDVIASHDHIDAKLHSTGRRWISVHTPHTHRLPINEIMRRQSQSKMSVSLPGAGRCCFRSVEAPVNTVPVMLDDGHAWSHPWNRTNCILINQVEMGKQLEQETQREDLYNLYTEAQVNIDRYRSNNYANNYILPSIEQCL